MKDANQDNRPKGLDSPTKLTYKQRLYNWAVSKDPAEEMLPLVALGVFAVAGGAITIALAIEYSQFIVYLGTAATILGAGTLAMALVLAALRRGSVRRKEKSAHHKSSSSTRASAKSSPDQ